MIIDKLAARQELLQGELHKAAQNVNTLTTQLEQAKQNLHTIGGHFNEVSILLVEERKEADMRAAATPPLEPPAELEPIKEQENGDINEQEPEQTPEV